MAVLAACGDDDDDDDERGGGGSEAASTEQADSCAKGQLPVKNSGQLTVGTDKPAFPPYFVDEVCFLHDGRIHERGDPAAVLSAPQQPETQRFLRRLLEAGRA